MADILKATRVVVILRRIYNLLNDLVGETDL